MHRPSALRRLWLVGFSTSGAAMLLAGCSPIGGHDDEVVMCPNSFLSVVVGGHTFSIRSPSYFTREVSVDSRKRTISLMSRRERWYGGLGLFTADGGNSHELDLFEEGIQHFSSQQEANDWLAFQRRLLPTENTSDGLVVEARYQTRPDDVQQGPEAALSIDVWVVLVNGSRPTQMPGARDDHFKQISLAPQSCSTPKPFVPSRETVIDGRRYSGRAVDFMKEQHIAARKIEQLISRGDRTEEDGRISFTSHGDFGNLFFVETRADGSVIYIG